MKGISFSRVCTRVCQTSPGSPNQSPQFIGHGKQNLGKLFDLSIVGNQAEMLEVTTSLFLDPRGVASLEHHLGQGLVEADVDLHAGTTGAAALLDADLAIAAVVGGVARGAAVVGLGADPAALDSLEADAAGLAGADRNDAVAAVPGVAALESRAGDVDEGGEGGGGDEGDGRSDDRGRRGGGDRGGAEAGAGGAVAALIDACGGVGRDGLGGGDGGLGSLTLVDGLGGVGCDGLDAALSDVDGAVADL